MLEKDPTKRATIDELKNSKFFNTNELPDLEINFDSSKLDDISSSESFSINL